MNTWRHRNIRLKKAMKMVVNSINYERRIN
jgi:hypothetical protein